MKGRNIPYSAAEMQWLEANRPLPIAEYHQGFTIAFDRTDVTTGHLHALRKRKGWKTGRTGRFVPGQVPANKGKAMPYHPNSAATRFKQGERRGVAVQLYKPIGTERLSKEGYLERKIHDGMPLQSRWRAVHLILWEALHGPVPEGFALKCLDSDRRNTDPSNWEAIPRGVLARLNGGRFKQSLAYDNVHADLKPYVMAVAKLKHGSGEARRRRRTG